ncbi:MAG: hypothetical protein ACXACY_27430 [Candidatus Hodarchaeales archaeon]|jgi:hypothetical protein
MEIENGRLTDVYIEENEKLPKWLYVWADEGLKDIFESIPGVVRAFNNDKCKYEIYIDPRYDVEWIKQEITAKAKIGQ